MHPDFFRIRQSAFSLIEIVLAVGIISFALVGIIGLFPTAINSALESQRQTQAALIAKRLFTDLKSPKPFIQKEGEKPKSSDFPNLSGHTVTKVTYDEGGALPGQFSGKGQLTTGSPVYLATVEITPDTPSEGLTTVQVDIATPANADISHQSIYRFVSILDTPVVPAP
jgi:uncharacterized protein (TIGR02598 family)